jgi:hypothetical protein
METPEKTFYNSPEESIERILKGISNILKDKKLELSRKENQIIQSRIQILSEIEKLGFWPKFKIKNSKMNELNELMNELLTLKIEDFKSKDNNKYLKPQEIKEKYRIIKVFILHNNIRLNQENKNEINRLDVICEINKNEINR